MRNMWAKETCGWLLRAELIFHLALGAMKASNLHRGRLCSGVFIWQGVGLAISSWLYCTSKWRGIFGRHPGSSFFPLFMPKVQEGDQRKGHQTFIIGKGKLSTIKPTDQNSPKGWLNAICLETMVLGIQRGFSWIMRHMQKCSTFLTALCWIANVPMLLKSLFLQWGWWAVPVPLGLRRKGLDPLIQGLLYKECLHFQWSIRTVKLNILLQCKI